MILYVESNFVLELVLEQEQAGQAKRLLAQAQSKVLDLVIPTFSLIEPAWTLASHVRRRQQLVQAINAERGQMQRSAHRKELTSDLESIVDSLRRIEQQDDRAFENAVDLLLNHARVIELTPRAVSAALRFRQVMTLDPQDAVVLACVVQDMMAHSDRETRFLVTRDLDFAKPEVRELLRQHGCSILNDFDEAASLSDRDAVR